MSAKVLMYCTAVCPYCIRAEQLLNRKGVVSIEKVRVDLEPARREEMVTRSGRRSVPQVFIGDTPSSIGDDALHRLRRIADSNLYVSPRGKL